MNEILLFEKSQRVQDLLQIVHSSKCHPEEEQVGAEERVVEASTEEISIHKKKTTKTIHEVFRGKTV